MPDRHPTVADAITGTPGIDSLSGTAGNDVIIGYQSADRHDRARRDDRYHVDTASDVVVEALGGGTDPSPPRSATCSRRIARSSASRRPNVLGISPIALTGNALANRLTGNAAAIVSTAATA